MKKEVNHLQQIVSAREYTLTRGNGQGLNVIDCDNRKIRFLLNASKGLDIMQLYYKGENCSFISKNGFTARELPFLRRFEGGALYTCGLDAVGGVDGHELHGEYHNTPAEVTRVETTEEGIFVEALIRDSALFGKNLLLRRKISVGIGESTIKLEDTLSNQGTRDEEFALLYHVNLGYPFLQDGGELSADGNISPRNAWAAADIENWRTISAAKDNEEERCYYLDTQTPVVTYRNPRCGKKFIVEYSKETLPHFVVWKSMASGDYALGLEPSTTRLDDYFTPTIIKKGEDKKFTLTLKIEE